MRGVWFVLKIHIVRKGDTLWEIAKQYGVDFEELKKSNPQLSSPDMIMPGMKIRIPSGTKSVKKETVKGKESKAPVAKEIQKQAPVIKEDDHAKPKEVKVEMPKKHIPEISPQLKSPKMELPIMEELHKAPKKPIKESPTVPVKPMKEMIKMPVMGEEPPMKLPEVSKPKKPKKEEKATHQVPVAPMYYHYCQPCCPPCYQHGFPVMGEMAGGFMPHHHMHHGHMVPPMQIQPQQMVQPHDCGCQAPTPYMQQYPMRDQIPFPGVNFIPSGYQTYINEPHTQTVPNELSHQSERSFPMPPAFPSFSESNHREDEQEQQTEKDK